MTSDQAGTSVRVVFGGALRLVLGQAEATVRVAGGTVQEVMDTLSAGAGGAPPLGVEHCLAVVSGRVVPRGQWSATVLSAGAMLTVYPPLAGGAPGGAGQETRRGRRKNSCEP